MFKLIFLQFHLIGVHTSLFTSCGGESHVVDDVNKMVLTIIQVPEQGAEIGSHNFEV